MCVGVGESEKAIQDVFAKASASAPCVLFFDEVQSVFGARDSAGNVSCVSRNAC